MPRPKQKRRVDEGYSYLKMKATETDPVVERLAAIRQAVGTQIKVVIDPMQRLFRPSVLDALCRGLEPYYDNVQCFEDPFTKVNLEWYRLMRTKIHFPLALHLGDGREVIEAVKAEACDYLNLGNGMVNFAKTAAIAEMAGIPVWHGSGRLDRASRRRRSCMRRQQPKRVRFRAMWWGRRFVATI